MSPQLLILVLLATFCHHSESKVSKVIPSWTSLATETERIDNDLEQLDKINGTDAHLKGTEDAFFGLRSLNARTIRQKRGIKVKNSPAKNSNPGKGNNSKPKGNSSKKPDVSKPAGNKSNQPNSASSSGSHVTKLTSSNTKNVQKQKQPQKQPNHAYDDLKLPASESRKGLTPTEVKLRESARANNLKLDGHFERIASSPDRDIKSIHRNSLSQHAVSISRDKPELKNFHNSARSYNDATKPMQAHEVLPSQQFVNAKFKESNTGTGFKHGGKPIVEVAESKDFDSRDFQIKTFLRPDEPNGKRHRQMFAENNRGLVAHQISGKPIENLVLAPDRTNTNGIMSKRPIDEIAQARKQSSVVVNFDKNKEVAGQYAKDGVLMGRKVEIDGKEKFVPNYFARRPNDPPPTGPFQIQKPNPERQHGA